MLVLPASNAQPPHEPLFVLPGPRSASERSQARPGTAEPKQVGLLARDDLALISGLLAREDDNGKIRLLAGAAGMTLVGNYAVSVNSHRTFVKRDTYDALVAEVREIVRGLIKHNETQAGR
jgi:hypothetical protein